MELQLRNDLARRARRSGNEDEARIAPVRRRLGLPAARPRYRLARADLQNLFDERYWQYYYSQIPPVNGEYLGGAYEDGLPGAPFSATFTVTARF